MATTTAEQVANVPLPGGTEEMKVTVSADAGYNKGPVPLGYKTWAEYDAAMDKLKPVGNKVNPST